MFKLTRHIGPYDQNLVRKKDFDIKSYLICSDIFLNYRIPQQFQYQEGLYVLETIFCLFLCSVQGVQCVLYNQQVPKSDGNKEDSDFKSGLT